MEDQTVTTKSAASLFTGMERFSVVEKSDDETFGEYVKLTAMILFGSKMGKRGKLVCKDPRGFWTVKSMVEDWPVERIVRFYNLSTKHCGDITPAHKWWTLRKQLLKENAHTS